VTFKRRPLPPGAAAAWLLAAFLLVPVTAPAQTPSPTAGPAWAQLTAAQQTALAPLKADWHELDRNGKAKWLEMAGRLPTMPEPERERVRQRMTDWARKTPEQRGEARVNFQQSKRVAPDERQARWEAYQALSAEERAALAARAKPAPGAASPTSPAQALRYAPVGAQAPKSNIVGPAAGTAGSALRPIAPTILQANSGATTSLVTKTPTPPPHQQPGQPKIAASPRTVDRATLLPKSGPQAADARPARPAPPAGNAAPPPAKSSQAPQ
jgi:hypothetical protein